jgi:hypothetical protein
VCAGPNDAELFVLILTEGTSDSSADSCPQGDERGAHEDHRSLVAQPRKVDWNLLHRDRRRLSISRIRRRGRHRQRN